MNIIEKTASVRWSILEITEGIVPPPLSLDQDNNLLYPNLYESIVGVPSNMAKEEVSPKETAMSSVPVATREGFNRTQIPLSSHR